LGIPKKRSRSGKKPYPRTRKSRGGKEGRERGGLNPSKQREWGEESMSRLLDNKGGAL